MGLGSSAKKRGTEKRLDRGTSGGGVKIGKEAQDDRRMPKSRSCGEKKVKAKGGTGE